MSYIPLKKSSSLVLSDSKGETSKVMEDKSEDLYLWGVLRVSKRSWVESEVVTMGMIYSRHSMWMEMCLCGG